VDSDHDITVREIARELTRLAKAIESLASEIKEDFTSLRNETVRADLYEANLTEIKRRLDAHDVRAKSLTTALTGMLLSIMGGVIIFLITRGISVPIPTGSSAVFILGALG